MASMDVGFQFLRNLRTMRECKMVSDYSKPSRVVVEECKMGSDYSKTSRVVAEIHTVNQWKAYINASRENNKLLVIEFTAKWCGPCPKMDPVMKDFAAKYTDCEFIKIDVDELESVAQQFDTATLPAFALMKKGKVADMVAGVKVVELQDKIEKHRI